MTTITPSTGGDPAFAGRHIGTTQADRQRMLERLGLADLSELLDAVVPAGVRSGIAEGLPPAADEATVATELAGLAARNRPGEAMIGLGYHPTITPAVIRRNVLESPSWYTAYTPYQPEISQGRLEALLNFQTVVADLTGLPIANASLLDEATAVAEAVTVMRRSVRGGAPRIVLDADCLPQTVAVVSTRCEAVGIEVVVADLADGLPDGEFFGLVVQYPGASGAVRDHRTLVAEAHERGAMVTVAADLLALTLLAPPGEWGADVVVGSAQRFGVPMGYGGPHAGFMAVRTGLERTLPGRLVGVSVDAAGDPAYRLALQTREQHIRREKATSNICTAQVLPAVIASMYAVYHGPEGLKRIAQRVTAYASILHAGLQQLGCQTVHSNWFDTVQVLCGDTAGRDAVLAAAVARGINLRVASEDSVSISLDETTTRADLSDMLGVFAQAVAQGKTLPEIDALAASATLGLPEGLRRTSTFLTHPVFNSHHSETEMLRYIRALSDKDLALDRSMIPLGSCTMKLNATSEMIPITWPEFAHIHPFAPHDQLQGYEQLNAQLCAWLAQATGYAGISLQPNAGSQGEYAGLLVIQAWHASRGEGHRDICLIPESAHGTNPASAHMAGMKVVVTKCDAQGNVDLDDLRAKCEQHSANLAAVMITYPSTYGVFETRVTELCKLVHEHGGRVYVDGANMNALVGLAAPGQFGGDVSHLNLHKTFCIPHGGGGPGVGHDGRHVFRMHDALVHVEKADLGG